MWKRSQHFALSALLAVGLAACGGGDSSAPIPAAPGAPPAAPPAPTTAAVVIAAIDKNGAPLTDARVAVAGSSLAGNTDASGTVTLDVPFADAVSIKVSKSGYTDKVEVLSVPDGASSLSVAALLMQRAPPQAIANIEAGGSASGVDGVKVTFPADALVNAQGQPVTGGVELFMTPVDVTTADVAGFPGLFEGIAIGGSRELLLSHGIAELVPTQAGQRLQLAPGKTALIELPLYADGDVDGNPIDVGVQLPFWSLDEATGLWKQEGTGEVVASAASPTGKALRATVSHFSWWNIDVPAQRHLLNLTIVGPNPCIPAGSMALINGAIGINRPPPPAPRGPTSATASVRFLTPIPLCATGVTRQIPLPAGLNITLSGTVTSLGNAYFGTVTAGGAAGQTSSATVTLTPITNPAPRITSPTDGSVWTVGNLIPIYVDVVGPVPDRVEIFAGSTLLAQFSPARPLYRVDWDTAAVAPGMVELRAVATRGSAVGSAAPVMIQLDPAPTPPTITSDVQDAIILAGQGATFAVTATGPSLRYAWRESTDGGVTFLPLGGNDRTLTLSNVPESANGRLYEVVVTNFLGSATSRRARLTVNSAPQVSVLPQVANIVAGQIATFSATATGTSPLAYQWQRSNDAGLTWTAISGATASVYAFTTALADNGARFRVMVNNAFGTATSNVAQLSVMAAPTPPVITAQPQSITRDAGQTASFSVTATGTTPLGYQWQRSNDLGVNYANIAGATVATYTLPSVSLNDASARFRVVVSNVAGSVTSSEATLNVNFFLSPQGARIAGASNTIARRYDDTVWVWGSIPSATSAAPTQQLTPVQVAGLSDIHAVAAGGNFQFPFFYALHQDGSVFAWGSNNNGQLGDGTTTHRQTPLAIPGLTRVIAIAAAEYTGYALREDGTVWSWGRNANGELGNGSAETRQLTPQPIPALSNIVAIGGYDMIAVAVRNDGALFAWGQGSNLTTPGLVWPAGGGQRRTATQITEITGAVYAAGSGGVTGGIYAITDAQRVASAWGANTNGMLGTGTFSLANVPTPVAGSLQPWTGIKGCTLHGVGWTAAGLGYAWGSNNIYGALGDPAVANRIATPNRVPALDQVVEMACGSEYHSLALRANGEVWAWGNNNRGQVGDGTTTTRPSPVLVFRLNGPPQL